MTEAQIRHLHTLLEVENFTEFFEMTLQLTENQPILNDRILVDSALWHDAQECIRQQIPLYLDNRDQISERTKQRLRLILKILVEMSIISERTKQRLRLILKTFVEMSR